MAQFVLPPPLEVVMPFFECVTGKPLEVGVTWSRWTPISEEAANLIRGYFRPCHRGALHEAETGSTKATLTLLRQILRPHRLKILANGTQWTLVEMEDVVAAPGVAVKTGKVVHWS